MRGAKSILILTGGFYKSVKSSRADLVAIATAIKNGAGQADRKHENHSGI